MQIQHMEFELKVSKPAESSVNLRLDITSLLVAPVKRSKDIYFQTYCIK